MAPQEPRVSPVRRALGWFNVAGAFAVLLGICMAVIEGNATARLMTGLLVALCLGAWVYGRFRRRG